MENTSNNPRQYTDTLPMPIRVPNNKQNVKMKIYLKQKNKCLTTKNVFVDYKEVVIQRKHISSQKSVNIITTGRGSVSMTEPKKVQVLTRVKYRNVEVLAAKYGKNTKKNYKTVNVSCTTSTKSIKSVSCCTSEIKCLFDRSTGVKTYSDAIKLSHSQNNNNNNKVFADSNRYKNNRLTEMSLRKAEVPLERHQVIMDNAKSTNANKKRISKIYTKHQNDVNLKCHPNKAGYDSKCHNRFDKLSQSVVMDRPCENNGQYVRQSQRINTSNVTNINYCCKLKCGSVNARSINNKADIIYEYLRENDLDLYMIVESWNDPNDPCHQKILSKIRGCTYNVKHAPRVGRAGGGCLVVYKKNLNIKKMKPPNVHTFEIMEILVQNKNKKLRLVVIYRPEPDTVKNPYTMTECYKEFTELFAYYKTLKEETIFCGDYNFHLNKDNDNKANKFREILDTFELKQHVQESTHREGNTLDLIISNMDSSVLSHRTDFMLSDHCNILFDLNMSKPPRIKKNITYRNTKLIDINDFKMDIRNSVARININDSLDNLVDSYQRNLLEVLDKHAPKQTKLVTIREKTPWTTEEIRPHKQELRRLERKMKRTKLEIDKQLFKDKKAKYKEFMDTKWNEHYTKLIQDNSADPKNLFNVINKALHKKEETPFPSGMSDDELANDFNEFFDGKIQTIRDNLDNTQNTVTPITETPKYTQQLTEFRSLSQDDVKKLISNSASKHCELDPLPTWLLKECMVDLLPLITQIINLSLQLGDMPTSFKKAIINPLLKKLGLELIKKNYRPVSNLAFISKLIEKAVASQLIEHLKLNKLYDKFQSAYRTFYSTETALLKVKNDILNAMDNRNIMLLLLLDLSAAFDTIDHSILLTRLSKRCGINGTCLKWFTSYLSNRQQMVKINDARSEAINVKYGVPQGSVLGPILFTIYTAPLGEIIEECGLQRQMYADDTGIYHSISPIDIESQKMTISMINTCIDKIKEFMILNKLKINDEKTIFMALGTNYWTEKLNIKSMNIGNSEIESSKSSKNLGIIFDKEMKLQEHVNYICKKGFYHVKDLFSLRKFLNQKETNTAAHAFVTSILDYGNSLFYGISGHLVEKMQVLQNAAVKAVVKKRKFDHISEDRMKLHWLPVEARIKFKYLLITWKCLHDKAPSYLQDLLKSNTNLRTQYHNTLMIPKVKNVTQGGIAFTKAAPILWNALPEDIRKLDKIERFKKSIKTYLFKMYNNSTHLKHH